MLAQQPKHEAGERDPEDPVSLERHPGRAGIKYGLAITVIDHELRAQGSPLVSAIQTLPRFAASAASSLGVAEMPRNDEGWDVLLELCAIETARTH